MTMVALELSPRIRQRVARVVNFARNPANWYRPHDSSVPGFDRRFRCAIGDHRCVFTYTVHPEGKVFRHLSISLLRGGGFPQPLATEVIAVLFGFTDSGQHPERGFDGVIPWKAFPASWGYTVKRNDPTDGNCVVVVQATDLHE